jgi:diguanylate cyclase (GGDEF)-like protein/PAS domain S-box-containing protein
MGNLPYSSLNFAIGTEQEPQRILVVDDEPRLRQSYNDLLAGLCGEIVECGDGHSAILALERGSFDVVLLDLKLPDMSGLDVLQWATRERHSGTIIIVSADTHIDSAIGALRGGAYEYVRKPCDPDQLVRSVTNALHRTRLERRNALMTARLEQSERLHRFLVDQSPDIIYTLGEDGCFVFISARIESLLGYARADLVGQHYTILVHEDDREHARFAFAERRTGGRAAANVELRLKCKDDGFRHFDNRFIVAMLSATGIYNGEEKTDAQRFMGTYGVARDITERKQAEEKISFQAFHDALTHLPNRTLFRDRLDLAITQARRNNTLVGLMFIDLDRFKLVNETYGHAEGDQLLKSIAQRFRQCLRSGDTLSRLGGDEFTVLLPDLSHADDIGRIAEKFLHSLHQPFTLTGQEFRATASLGIAVFPRDGHSTETLLRNADLAMYQTKSRGKNGYTFFTAEMSEDHRERIGLENDLRRAIENHELVLHYQPQVSLADQRTVGMEALVRWRHPTLGLLAPDRFIELAEEVGLIHQISDWVLQAGCAQLARWHSEGHRDLRLAFNLSAKDFDRDDLIERVTAAPAAHGIGADLIEVEITESLLLDDAEGIIDTVRRLRQRGVRVSIDDFGTRYSSLNYLRRFPVSSVKIDQSFVRDLGHDQGAASIIHAIVGIAQGFGLHLLAEGVETREQADFLRDLGCKDMQGYLFGRPVPAEEVTMEMPGRLFA